MANQIHQHPDGTISVRVDDKIYSDTEKNFKKDFGSGFPKLPPGVDERLYEQGVRHALTAKNSVVDGGPVPWKTGDDYIGSLDDALASQQKRLDDDFKVAKKKVDDEAEQHQKNAKDNVDRSNAENAIKVAKDTADREVKRAKDTEDFEKAKKKRDDEDAEKIRKLPKVALMPLKQG
jgi:hypothetical protein